METSKLGRRFIELKNLKELREIAGLTQQELSHLVQIAHGTVRAIETGHKAYSSQLVRQISERLGCGMTVEAKGKLAELTLTRIDSDEPYTKEWFEHWNEICLRKQIYTGFLRRYADLISNMLEATCAIDIEREAQNLDLPERKVASTFVDRLRESIPLHLADSDVHKHFLEARKRSFAARTGSREEPPEIGEEMERALEEGLKKYQRSIKRGQEAKKG